MPRTGRSDAEREGSGAIELPRTSSAESLQASNAGSSGAVVDGVDLAGFAFSEERVLGFGSRSFHSFDAAGDGGYEDEYYDEDGGGGGGAAPLSRMATGVHPSLVRNPADSAVEGERGADEFPAPFMRGDTLVTSWAPRGEHTRRIRGAMPGPATFLGWTMRRRPKDEDAEAVLVVARLGRPGGRESSADFGRPEVRLVARDPEEPPEVISGVGGHDSGDGRKAAAHADDAEQHLPLVRRLSEEITERGRRAFAGLPPGERAVVDDKAAGPRGFRDGRDMRDIVFVATAPTYPYPLIVADASNDVAVIDFCDYDEDAESWNKVPRLALEPLRETFTRCEVAPTGEYTCDRRHETSAVAADRGVADRLGVGRHSSAGPGGDGEQPRGLFRFLAVASTSGALVIRVRELEEKFTFCVWASEREPRPERELRRQVDGYGPDSRRMGCLAARPRGGGPSPAGRRPVHVTAMAFCPPEEGAESSPHAVLVAGDSQGRLRVWNLALHNYGRARDARAGATAALRLRDYAHGGSVSVRLRAALADGERGRSAVPADGAHGVQCSHLCGRAVTGAPFRALVFSPVVGANGRPIFATATRGSAAVLVWTLAAAPLAAGEPASEFEREWAVSLERVLHVPAVAADDEVVHIAFSPDGCRIVATTTAGRAAVFDSETSQLVHVFDSDSGSAGASSAAASTGPEQASGSGAVEKAAAVPHRQDQLWAVPAAFMPDPTILDSASENMAMPEASPFLLAVCHGEPGVVSFYDANGVHDRSHYRLSVPPVIVGPPLAGPEARHLAMPAHVLLLPSDNASGGRGRAVSVGSGSDSDTDAEALRGAARRTTILADAAGAGRAAGGGGVQLVVACGRGTRSWPLLQKAEQCSLHYRAHADEMRRNPRQRPRASALQAPPRIPEPENASVRSEPRVLGLGAAEDRSEQHHVTAAAASRGGTVRAYGFSDGRVVVESASGSEEVDSSAWAPLHHAVTMLSVSSDLSFLLVSVRRAEDAVDGSPVPLARQSTAGLRGRRRMPERGAAGRDDAASPASGVYEVLLNKEGRPGPPARLAEPDELSPFVAAVCSPRSRDVTVLMQADQTLVVRVREHVQGDDSRWKLYPCFSGPEARQARAGGGQRDVAVSTLNFKSEDARAQAISGTFVDRGDPVTLAVSASGQFVAGAVGHVVQIWDIASRTTVLTVRSRIRVGRRMQPDPVTSLSFHPSLSLFTYGTWTGGVCLHSYAADGNAGEAAALARWRAAVEHTLTDPSKVARVRRRLAEISQDLADSVALPHIRFALDCAPPYNEVESAVQTLCDPAHFVGLEIGMWASVTSLAFTPDGSALVAAAPAFLPRWFGGPAAAAGAHQAQLGQQPARVLVFQPGAPLSMPEAVRRLRNVQGVLELASAYRTPATKARARRALGYVDVIMRASPGVAAYRDSCGNTLLHWIARKERHEELLECLLDHPSRNANPLILTGSTAPAWQRGTPVASSAAGGAAGGGTHAGGRGGGGAAGKAARANVAGRVSVDDAQARSPRRNARRAARGRSSVEMHACLRVTPLEVALREAARNPEAGAKVALLLNAVLHQPVENRVALLDRTEVLAHLTKDATMQALFTRLLMRMPLVPASSRGQFVASGGWGSVRMSVSRNKRVAGSDCARPHGLWKAVAAARERGAWLRPSACFGFVGLLQWLAKYCKRGRAARAAEARSVAVRPTVVGLPGLARSENLKLLVDNRCREALSSPPIRSVLRYKWVTYAKRDVQVTVVRYLLILALFTLSTLPSTVFNLDEVCPNYRWPWEVGHSFVDDAPSGYGRLAADGALFFFLLLKVWTEIKQVAKERAVYIKNPWNVLDVGLCASLSAFLVERFEMTGAECDESTVRQTAAVTAVFMWIKLLDFSRGHRKVGTLTRVIFAVLSEIAWLLFVTVVVLVGFAHGFALLFATAATAVEDVPFDAASATLRETLEYDELRRSAQFGSWDVFFHLYSAVLGDFDQGEMDNAESVMLARTFFVAFSLIFSIIFVNLLIALLSTVYSRITKEARVEWSLEYAALILEQEDRRTGGGSFAAYLLRCVCGGRACNGVRRACRRAGSSACGSVRRALGRALDVLLTPLVVLRLAYRPIDEVVMAPTWVHVLKRVVDRGADRRKHADDRFRE